jgi:serine/threonine-protein kinase HipA
MSVNGKRTDFIKDDVLTVAGEAGVKKPEEIIRQVVEAVGEWPELAKKAGVPVKRIKDIRSQHRGL